MPERRLEHLHHLRLPLHERALGPAEGALDGALDLVELRGRRGVTAATQRGREALIVDALGPARFESNGRAGRALGGSALDDAMRDVAEVRSGGHRALRADPHLVPPGGRPVARDGVESVALQARRRHAWDEEQDDRDDPPSRHDPWPPAVRADAISAPMDTNRRPLS